MTSPFLTAVRAAQILHPGHSFFSPEDVARLLPEELRFRDDETAALDVVPWTEEELQDERGQSVLFPIHPRMTVRNLVARNFARRRAFCPRNVSGCGYALFSSFDRTRFSDRYFPTISDAVPALGWRLVRRGYAWSGMCAGVPPATRELPETHALVSLVEEALLWALTSYRDRTRELSYPRVLCGDGDPLDPEFRVNVSVASNDVDVGFASMQRAIETYQAIRLSRRPSAPRD